MIYSPLRLCGESRLRSSVTARFLVYTRFTAPIFFCAAPFCNKPQHRRLTSLLTETFDNHLMTAHGFSSTTRSFALGWLGCVWCIGLTYTRQAPHGQAPHLSDRRPKIPGATWGEVKPLQHPPTISGYFSLLPRLRGGSDDSSDSYQDENTFQLRSKTVVEEHVEEPALEDKPGDTAQSPPSKTEVEKPEEIGPRQLTKDPDDVIDLNIIRYQTHSQDRFRRQRIQGTDLTGDGGVVMRIVRKGNGTATPKLGDFVYVHYRGFVGGGREFDDSRRRDSLEGQLGLPFGFHLGRGEVLAPCSLHFLLQFPRPRTLSLPLSIFATCASSSFSIRPCSPFSHLPANLPLPQNRSCTFSSMCAACT